MRKPAIALVILVLLVLVGLAIAGVERGGKAMAYRFNGAPLEVRQPRGAPRGMVLLLVSEGDDEADIRELGRKLENQGLTTVLLDMERAKIPLQGGKCLNYTNFLHNVSKDVQHRLGFERFLSPALGGGGQGAIMALAAYKQAADGLYSGLVTQNPAETLLAKTKPCGDFVKRTGKQGVFTVDPGTPPPATWIRVRPGTPPDAAPLLQSAGADELPLTVVPATASNETDVMAVLYSGDGGWAGLDKRMAAEMAERGVPVVGISSLEYFWRERPPAEAAADLARVMRDYRARWGKRRVVLIGYSYGADVLPFVYRALPPEERATVARVDLLGLSDTADFQFHLGSWLDISGDNARPTAPEADAINDTEVSCIRGSTEKGSACLSLKNPRIRQIEIPGDHHFNGDQVAVVNALLADLPLNSDGGAKAPPARGVQ